jgi:hypothetical protein
MISKLGKKMREGFREVQFMVVPYTYIAWRVYLLFFKIKN